MEEKRDELIKKIQEINANIKITKELCNHNLVFKIDNFKSTNIKRFSTYYCPICDSIVEIYNGYEDF